MYKKVISNKALRKVGTDLLWVQIVNKRGVAQSRIFAQALANVCTQHLICSEPEGVEVPAYFRLGGEIV